MSSAESLPLLLKRLALPSIYAHWENKAEEAQQGNWTYPQYLSSLCNIEASARYQRRVQRHIKESKLPPGKTLCAFDFDSAPSVNGAHIKAIADDIGWVNQAENIVLFGPSGVGKSHLAAAIGYRLIEQGTRVLYTSATMLVQKLQQAKSQMKLPEMLAKLSRIPVLIIDDIGYVKKSEAETSVLFELIADRYETTSLIVTSNQPFGEWDQIFCNDTMAVAAIDRLVHHAQIINIQGESYRKSSSQRERQESIDGM